MLIQTLHVKAVISRIKLGTCEIRRLNWVMVTASFPVLLEIAVVTLYDTYGIFYVPLNFAFNLPHVASYYMHHTGKKKRE